MSREWSPMRAAYEPRVWPYALATMVLNVLLAIGGSLAVGYTFGLTAQLVFMVPIFAFSAWSGAAVVNWCWGRWRAENPERAYREWVREPQS